MRKSRVMSYRLIYQMKRSVYIAAVGMVVLEMARGLSQAQMTAKEFDALPDTDKRVVLVSSLEERERSVRNLQAQSTTHLYNVRYRNGKTGPLVKDLGRYVCELRRKDGNHWASIDWFLPEDPDHPNVKVITSMDAKSGVSKSVAQHVKMDGVYGAIATEEDIMIKSGHFHYWFDALFDMAEEFPISFLLKHQEAVKFEGLSGDSQEIKITLHVEVPERQFQDTRTVWIAPQRGFMPVRMHRRWEYKATAPGRTPLYTETDSEVKKMEQVDGVWFPTHFTDTSIGRLSVAEGYASVFETTVGRIKLGAITDDDLKVNFGDKVQVQDRIKGVWFTADKATQSAPSFKAGATGEARKWLITVNLFAILAFTAFAALRKRRRKIGDAFET